MNGHEMLPEVGKEKRNIRTTIQIRARIAIGRDQRPMLHTRSRFHSSVVRPKVDRHRVRRVQEDRADRGHDHHRDAAPDPEGEERQDEGADHHRRQCVGRRPVAVRDLLQPARSGDAVIAAEGEQHSPGRGDRREAAEAHRNRDAAAQDATQAGAQVLVQGVEHCCSVAEVVLAVDGRVSRGQVGREERCQIRQVQRDRHQEDVSGDSRDRHRQEDAPRARPPGTDRLLGDVRRGVIAGVRPVGLQQAEEEGKEDAGS